VVGSATITFLSRNSLRDRHSYGYYRFFTFEFILLLVVTNLRVWFNDILSPLQLVSWMSLLGSLYLVISAFNMIGLSKATGVDDSGEVIDKGIYRKVRHPLYSSLLFFALGVYLKEPSLFSSILMFGVIFTLLAAVRAEEEVNLRKFGARYHEYKQKTKMFIPYIF
jgi:protein-S-isoprenylcysteine O-methyltransferase Ste14